MARLRRTQSDPNNSLQILVEGRDTVFSEALRIRRIVAIPDELVTITIVLENPVRLRPDPQRLVSVFQHGDNTRQRVSGMILAREGHAGQSAGLPIEYGKAVVRGVENPERPGMVLVEGHFSRLVYRDMQRHPRGRAVERVKSLTCRDPEHPGSIEAGRLYVVAAEASRVVGNVPKSGRLTRPGVQPVEASTG